MRVYSVRAEKDEEWHVVVVARTARDAKRHAWPVLKSFSAAYEGDLLMDIRVRWLRDITPPIDTAGRVYDCCKQQHWMCGAWDYDAEDHCMECEMHDRKLAEWGDRPMSSTSYSVIVMTADGRTVDGYVISTGIGEKWAIYRRKLNGSLSRVKSPALRDRGTAHEAQADLASWLHKRNLGIDYRHSDVIAAERKAEG